MKTVLITGPTSTPITVDDVKAHCRITSSTEDIYLESLVKSAIEHIEQVTGRKLINQTWKLLIDEWPDTEIELPFGQCSAVNSVKYTDKDSNESTWDASNYIVDTDSAPGRVVIGYDKSWPTAQLLHVNPIAVEFVSGYGANAAAVPADLKHAIKLLVAHLYENREPVMVGQAVTNIPLTVDRLIWSFRLFSF